MSDASEDLVTFRLAPRDRAAISRLVDKGEFTNRSDFLRYAIKSTLEKYSVDGKAVDSSKLDLEIDTPAPRRGLSRPHLGDLEGVELPQHASGARRGRASAGKTRRGL